MLLLAVGLFLWRTALPAAQARTYAFSAYYTAARLTLAGQGGVRFCGEWFFAQERALGFGRLADYFCPNPPTNALAMVPVAWLPPGPARYGWIAIDLLLIVALLAIGWRIVVALQQRARASAPENLPPKHQDTESRNNTLLLEKHRSFVSWCLRGFKQEFEAPLGRTFSVGALTYTAVAAVAVALYRPLHADLHAGQVYTLLALFYALWLYGFVIDSAWLAGAGLAGLVLLKLAGWPLWLLMLAARRGRALAWAIGLGLTVGLLTLPLFGLDFWLTYLFRQAPLLDADPTIASPSFQTLISLLRQLFVYDARWSPRPLVGAPWLASLLWWAIALALLGLTLWRLVPGLPFRPARGITGTPPVPVRAGLAMLCLVVPLQPAGEEHHYALLLVAVIVLLLVPGLALARSRLAVAAAALALCLLLLPAYYVRDAWMGWPWALLAYPRMYGALLLWAALVAPGADVQANAAEQVQITHL